MVTVTMRVSALPWGEGVRYLHLHYFLYFILDMCRETDIPTSRYLYHLQVKLSSVSTNDTTFSALDYYHCAPIAKINRQSDLARQNLHRLDRTPYPLGRTVLYKIGRYIPT